MSVLASTEATEHVAQAVLEAARPLFAARVWAYYKEHKDTVLLTKKVFGMFTITIHLRDLHFLIERIVGPEP